jgi:DNA polymerase III delta prime subunit
MYTPPFLLENTPIAPLFPVRMHYVTRRSYSDDIPGPRILLCGGKGVGKTTVATCVAEDLERPKHLQLCQSSSSTWDEPLNGF